MALGLSHFKNVFLALIADFIVATLALLCEKYYK